MEPRSWTWIHLVVATAIYWVLLAVGWWLYSTRPSQQAKARASAKTRVVPGSNPGEELHVYSGEINLGPAFLVALAPPLLLWIAWALF